MRLVVDRLNYPCERRNDLGRVRFILIKFWLNSFHSLLFTVIHVVSGFLSFLRFICLYDRVLDIVHVVLYGNTWYICMLFSQPH